METESENEGSEEIVFRPSYPPYIRLYEEEEHRARVEEEYVEATPGEKVTAYKHLWKFHKAQRFFDSIIGFHEVRKRTFVEPYH
jgi:hypothetical protein